MRCPRVSGDSSLFFYVNPSRIYKPFPDEWQTIANLSGKRPESRTVGSVYFEAVDLVAAHGWIAFERDGSENRNGCSQDYD